MTTIETSGLARRFGAVDALRGIDLQVPEGEVLGLLGPNGSGKSTLLRILATVLAPTAGKAYVNGHEVLGDPAAVRRAVGYVPQAPTSDADLTAIENLQFYAALRSVPWKQARPRAERLLGWMDLQAVAHRPVRTFSIGMRRRLEIARTLLHEPRILLLDEPSNGLDLSGRLDLFAMLHRLRKEHGLTLVFATHHMEEAEDVSGRLILLDRGRIAAGGSSDSLKASLQRGSHPVTLTDVYLHYAGTSHIAAAPESR